MTWFWTRQLLTIATVVMCLPGQLLAQPVADFYQGKRLTVYVGSSTSSSIMAGG